MLLGSTYQNALTLGAEIVPAILGEDTSILRESREIDIVREYRQRAMAESKIKGHRGYTSVSGPAG